VTGRARYRAVAVETVEYMLRELWIPGQGFASAQDADTEGVEGLTFTWGADEGVPEHVLRHWEHGRHVLRGELDDETRARLWQIRSRRPQPARDDKVIASWNGLALAAVAEAGRRLDRPGLVEVGRELAEALGDEPVRSRRDGRMSGPGFLDDYANVAHGLLELHIATGELRWLERAQALALRAVERFADRKRGGFFLSAEDGEALVARKKELDDNPIPSGNSMLASVLLRLSRIYGDDELERSAVGVFRLALESARRVPSAFGHLLCALDLHFAPPREIAVVGSVYDDVARAALTPWEPASVVAVSGGAGDDSAQRVPLLAGKDLVNGRTAVYVCERFACKAPVTDARQLIEAAS
jgi:uncharacterized protein YyaL (SSP411 family)